MGSFITTHAGIQMLHQQYNLLKQIFKTIFWRLWNIQCFWKIEFIYCQGLWPYIFLISLMINCSSFKHSDRYLHGNYLRAMIMLPDWTSLSNPHAEHDKLFTLHSALGLNYQGSRNRLLTTDCIKQLRSTWFKTHNEITANVMKTDLILKSIPNSEITNHSYFQGGFWGTPKTIIKTKRKLRNSKPPCSRLN